MDFFDSNPTAKQAPQWHNACGFKTEQCNETPNALKPFKTAFFSTGCANVMAMCNTIVKRNLLPKEVSLRWPQGWPPTTSTCQNPGAKIIQCAIFPEIIFNVFDVFTLSIVMFSRLKHWFHNVETCHQPEKLQKKNPPIECEPTCD